MTVGIPIALRTAVRELAQDCCEYCLLPQSAALHRHEPDHVVPRQHGGATVLGNLALACMRCNRYKGPNVGSFDPQSGLLTAFFNPGVRCGRTTFVTRKDSIILLLQKRALLCRSCV